MDAEEKGSDSNPRPRIGTQPAPLEPRLLERKATAHSESAAAGVVASPRSSSGYQARRVTDIEKSHTRKTILIVEDNRLNTKLFRDLLEIAGYRTLQTNDGVAAFDMTKTHRPDLVLMDIRLPQVSGLEVVQWIRQDPVLHDTPIIAVTAFAMEGDETQILGAGCNAYLRKPISIETFLAAVAGLIGRDDSQAD